MELMNQNNLNIFGGKQGLLSKVKELDAELKRQGKTPEQFINELIQSGKMTQSDLTKYKQMASLVSNIL